MRTLPRLIVSLVLLVPVVARAEKITIDDDTFVNVGLLIQPQLTVTEDAAPDGGVGTDFFLRRARFIVTGQYDPHINFVFITDQANWGKNGDFTTQFIVQDAIAAYKLGPELTVSAGFMLLPFLRNNYQSAGALNLVDYRAGVIKFPPTGRAFRDMGVELRGLLAQDRIYYRGGVFSGIAGTPGATPEDPDINPADAPRFTGTVRFNILGKDEAYAPAAISFGTDPLFSVGVAVDWQEKAFGEESDTRYLGLSADVFVDYPLPGDQEIAAQAGILRYDNYLSPAGPDEALAFFVEGGYRIAQIEPVAGLEYFDGDVPGTKVLSVKLGLNWWISKHTYNIKAEVTIPNNEEVDGVTAPENLLGILQAQLAF